MDNAIELPEMWVAVGEHAGGLEEELRREVASEHPLQGCRVRAIAQRVDTDDVLFRVDGPPLRYALVHLTWRGRTEPDPRWPGTQFFASLPEWAACEK